MMIQTDTVHALASLPATDLNLTSCLQRATDNQIRLALETMRNRDGKDKGRIKACERELKRREIQVNLGFRGLENGLEKRNKNKITC